MDSIAPECTAAKQKYESCFHTWYSEKFLKGDTTDDCAALFKEYRDCLEVSMMLDHVINWVEISKGKED